MFTENIINIASIIKGLDCELVRDVDFSYIGKIPTQLNRRVVPATTPKYIESALENRGIVGLIVMPEHMKLVPNSMGCIIAKDPIPISLKIHERLCEIDGFHWKQFETQIHSSARIHPSAVISEHDVLIGPNVEVGPNSVVLERSILDEEVRIGVGVAVGLDAFEIFEEANTRRILKQAGGVWMKRGATVLGKSTIVRATFGGYTRIEQNAMLDVLIHVAHDVVINENATVIACAEISGRCELGKGSYVGPNACISNGIHIGENSIVTMGAVVTRDVPAENRVTGNFAVPHASWIEFMRTFKKHS